MKAPDTIDIKVNVDRAEADQLLAELDAALRRANRAVRVYIWVGLVQAALTAALLAVAL